VLILLAFACLGAQQGVGGPAPSEANVQIESFDAARVDCPAFERARESWKSVHATRGRADDEARTRTAQAAELVIQDRCDRQPREHAMLLWALAALAAETGDLSSELRIYQALLDRTAEGGVMSERERVQLRGNLAQCLQNSGEFARALELQELNLDEIQRLGPAVIEVEFELNLRMDHALTLFQLGRLADARTLLDGVAVDCAERLPAGARFAWQARANLAAVIDEMGETEEALSLFEELVEEGRSTRAPLDPDLLQVEQSLAITLHRAGDLPRARELLDSVVAGYEALLPEGHPILRHALGSLGNVLMAEGDLTGALLVLERAALAEGRAGPNDPLLLDMRLNLAGVLQTLGDGGRARALLEPTLAAMRGIYPSGQVKLLQASSNLAGLFAESGDFLGARAVLERALEEMGDALPPDDPRISSARQALAITLERTGEHERARELFEQLLAIADLTLPGSERERIGLLFNLGCAEAERGEWERSRAILEEVAAAWQQRLPAEHPDVLDARANLADVLSATGDVPGAIALLEELLPTCTGAFPPGHPLRVRVRESLLRAHLAAGEIEAARSAAKELLGDLRFAVEDHRLLSPREARAAAAQTSQRLALVLSVPAPVSSEPSADQECFELIETLRSLAVASPALAGSDPELRALRDADRNLRGQIHDLSLAGPVDAPELQRLALERDGLERRMRARLDERGVRARAVQLGALARALPPTTAAIAYSSYARQRAGSARAESQDCLLAFVVRPEGNLARVELGPMSEIEGLVEEWRAAVGQPIAGRGVSVVTTSAPDSEAAHRAGERLRARVLDPLLARTGTVKKLLVSLDEALHLVPLDALPLEGGFLGDVISIRHEIALGRLLLPAPAAVSGSSALVAIGGVDYDAALSERASPVPDALTPTLPGDSREGTGSGPWRTLPGTQQEVAIVRSLFEAELAGPVHCLSGSDATKERFHELAGGARFLHVATHGYFAPEVAAGKGSSALDLRFGAARLDASASVHGFAPMVLCGLTLAGANHGRDSLGRVNGILTAEELCAFDFGACELAVLSACETNVGIRRAGQGIQSLQTALHAAGARTAITSLWRVDDAATRRLFELFYTKLWKDHIGKADALWQAKMALRAEGHPPRDWAGWVLSGDPD